MKNYHTPRTLADASFHTGYPIKTMRPPTVRVSTLAILAFTVVGLLFLWWAK